jgi:hypothetical protein
VSDNPYSPTRANIDPGQTVLDRAQGRINRAVIAGAASVGCTALATGMGLSNDLLSGNQTPLDVISFCLGDFLLVAGLAYGTYRKSRACALIQFVYSLGWKFFMVVIFMAMIKENAASAIGSAGALATSSLVTFYCFMGVLGTFAYRKQLEAGATAGAVEPSIPTPT